MNLDHFGMDTITPRGRSRPSSRHARGRLHPGDAERQRCRRTPGRPGSGGRDRAPERTAVTGFQVLRDFEGCRATCMPTRWTSRKQCSRCAARSARLLLACSSTSTHATGDFGSLTKDLQKLAMLAVPHGIRIAYEALGVGTSASTRRPGRSSPRPIARTSGSRSIPSTCSPPAPAARRWRKSPAKIFLVQLADFMWQRDPSREERINTARHFRVFPGEGVHSAEVAELVRTLDRHYRGDYSFEVFNDDYTQLPVAVVTERARRSVKWLTDQVSRRSRRCAARPANAGASYLRRTDRGARVFARRRALPPGEAGPGRGARRGSAPAAQGKEGPRAHAGRFLAEILGNRSPARTSAMRCSCRERNPPSD